MSALPEATLFEIIARCRKASEVFEDVGRLLLSDRLRAVYLRLREIPSLVAVSTPQTFFTLSLEHFVSSADKLVQHCIRGELLEARAECAKSHDGLKSLAEFLHAEAAIAALEPPHERKCV